MNEQDRLALQYVAEEIAKAEARIYEHVSTTFRWLMATLFTANGGAIVALLAHDVRLGGSLYALACFAAGTICSLLMGVLSTWMGHRAAPQLMNARGEVHQALITGDASEAQQVLANLVADQRMNWKKWSPTYAGLASLAFFIGGIATITVSLLH